jgi:DNA-binding MarR family transcriptional regulator
MIQPEFANYGALIERAHKLLKQHFQRRLHEVEAGITVDQWMVLDVLFREGEMSHQDIAQLTAKDAPTLTRIVDLLVQKGLVARLVDEDDRRRLRIDLTTAGETLVKRLLPVVIAWREQGWEGLQDEDYQTLLRILGTMSRNFDVHEVLTPRS